tara:strand:+ start:60150 stop:84038 length:23889 start_codon:yes stop_codon:yes gene_type:complete
LTSATPAQSPDRSSTNAELLEDRTMLTSVVSIDDVEVVETYGAPFYPTYARLTVTRTGDVPEDMENTLIVRYATQDGTAKSSSFENDYEETSGSFLMYSFYSGELVQTATILVEINVDSIPELDETFQVKLTSVSGYNSTLGDDTGTVTIVDNDRNHLWISDVTVNEGDGTASVTVSMDRFLDTVVSVDYTTADIQTATSSQDYESTSGTITFQPNELTKTIQINIVDDSSFELDEAFYVELSNLQTDTITTKITDDRAVVTIEDNDRSFPIHYFDFEEQSKILPPPGTSPDSDTMGFAMAADGNTLIATAPYWDNPLNNQGAAFVYIRNDQGTPQNRMDDTWDYQTTLLAPDAKEADQFGWSVDLSGDTAVIGSRFGKKDGDENGDETGSAYVFTRSGTTWTFQQELTPSDGGYFDEFSVGVAIEGDTIMVGMDGGWGTSVHSNGALYVFNQVNGVWSETQILSNPDLGTADQFASEIDFEGSTLVVNAYLDNESDNNQGAVYIYNLVNGQWSLLQTLKPETPVASGQFGYAISLESNELLIGAPTRLVGSELDGNAFLYRYNAELNQWVLKQTLSSENVQEEERAFFGSSVLLQDGMMFIGARNYNASTDYSDGALYQYRKEGSDWTLYDQFSTPDGSTNFDFSDFSGNIALAGGALFYYDNQLSNNSGSIYSFVSPETPIVAIKDTVIAEGDDSSRLVSIEVTRTGYLPGDLNAPATVYFNTLDGTATVADGLYQAASGTITFAADPTAVTQTQTFTVEIAGDTLVELDDHTFSVSLYSITGRGRIVDPDAVITIAEDDQAIVSAEDITINEGAGSVVIPITLSKPVDHGVYVYYDLSNLTTVTIDYEDQQGTLYYAPGTQTQEIEVTIADDNRTEFTEQFQLDLNYLQAGGYNVIIADEPAKVTILDNDQTVLSFEDVSFDENEGRLRLKASLSRLMDGRITGTFDITNLSSTISGGSDLDDYFFYQGMSITDFGSNYVYVYLSINNDDHVELNEKFLASLTNIQINGMDLEDAGIDFVLGDIEAEVTIIDDDQASLTISDATVNEAAGTATVTVTLDQIVEGDISVDYTTVGQSADPDTDFLSTAGTLTFAQGEQSKTITVSIVDSDLIEGDETFLVSLSNFVNNGLAVTLNKQQGTVTIKDDEEATLSINDVTVNEAAGTATLTVTLDQAVATPVSVDFATVNQTATSSEDFQATSGTLTFSPDELTKTITVSIVDSTAVEADERFLINLTNIQANNANITLADAQGEVTIHDDEQATISISDLTVDESTGLASLTVSLDQPVDAEFSVDFDTTDQSALQSVDYQYSSGTLTFSAGEQTKTLNISLINSDLVEPDETFLVTLSNIQSAGADLSFTDNLAQVTILDEDQAGVSISDTVVNEGAGTVDITVSLDNPVYTSVTVDYATASQSADPIDDYLTKSGTLTFDPGEQSKTITVSIVDSALVEGDEIFLVNLANLQSASTEVYLADSQGEVTIHDDEQATLSIDDLQVNEDAGTATLTVTLSQAASIPVNVNYATADQSAVSTGDYQANSGTLTFDPGDLTKTITVSLIDSATPEIDETFLVNLSNIQANNANITFADDQAIVTIRDDQTTISINDVSVDEDAGTALLTVSLNHTLSENLSINFATADQTAKQPDDYQSTSGTLEFGAGDLTKTISIPLVYTESVEKTETFLVNLSNIQVNGFTVILTDAQGRVTILDHDQASLSISDTTVNESAGTVSVTVSLDHPVATYLNLDYTTNAGPYATSPEYYEATSGTLIFLPGQTTATIEINLVDNSYVEPDVYFYVDISNLNSSGTAVSIADARAKVTIQDNDRDYTEQIYDFEYGSKDPYDVNTKINAPEFVSDQDQFSFKTAADGEIMISTAPFLDAPLSDQGGAFVYVRNHQGTPQYVFDDTWEYQATLLAPDAQAADHFGWSIDISGDTAVIGALNVDSTENNGAVYIFTRSGATWTFQQKLTPDSADTNLQFGTEVSIEGNTLVVGATQDHNGHGAVHIYKRVSGVWSLFQSIPNPDAFGQDAEFGTSIDLENRNLVIGAAQHDSGKGAVYIYHLTSDDQWTLQQKLSSPTPLADGTFGISVSIENDELVIGEPGAYYFNHLIGKAYLYHYDADLNFWSLDQTISRYASWGDLQLGTQVLLQNGMLFLTAAHDPDYDNDETGNPEDWGGIAFQYIKVGSEWVTNDVFYYEEISNTFVPFNRFAHQITLADGALFVTAPLADDLGTGTGTIYYYHPLAPEFTVDTVSVSEGNDGTQTVTLEVTREAFNPGDLSAPATIEFLTGGGTAEADVDYQSASGTLYFNADPTALTQTLTLTVEIIGDSLLETDEYFFLRQFLVFEDGRKYQMTSGRVTITNDDQAALSISDETVDEAAGTVTLTVSLDKEFPTEVSVQYATVANTADINSDYRSKSGTLTFAPGEVSKTITVTILDSSNVEPDQSFYVNLSNLQSATSGIMIADSQAEVTIVDDDQALLYLAGSSNITENTVNPTLRLYLSRIVETTVSVDFATTDDSATSPDDYQSISGTAVFNPSDRDYYIEIPFVDTDLVELDEKLLLNLTNLQAGGANVVLQYDMKNVYIRNDDQASVSISDTVVDEAAGTATVTVTLDHPVDTSVTVDYATAGLSAEPDTDFLTKSGTITFAPEELTKTITFSIVDSNLIEGDEIVLVYLTNLQADEREVILADDQATVTIHDDDQANLSINDISVNEDVGTATLTVSLDRAASIDVNVDYSTMNDSAVAMTDYVATSGTLTINANHLTGTITIPITDTDLVELEETLLVNLSNIQANNANIILTDNQGAVTITDDDQAAISIDDLIVDENTGIATLTVSLDHPVDTSITVDFTTADQSALQSDDYQSTSGTVIFNAGEQTHTITIPLIDTEILERNETFLVNLTSIQAGGRNVVIADDQAIVTIQEDQAAFSISDATVDETAGTATVTVTLDKAVDTTITVDYATSDQTAGSPDDYLSKSGTLTFVSGELSKTITVPIVYTDSVEGDERFLVNLSNIQSSGRNVVLADGEGEITIYDDDLTTVSINDVTVNEDAGTATLTVSLGQIVTTDVNVDYSMISNSAVATTDYVNTPGTMTITAGSLTGTFTISIVDSDQVEDEEKFLINLTNIQANNANLIFIDAQGSVTITDNDQAGISIDDVTVNENAGTATLTVSLDKPVETNVSVSYSTADQSAVQSADYQAKSGTFIFSAGEQTKTITIPILTSDQVEIDETFLVNLSNIQSDGRNVVFTDNQGEITIHDEGQAALSIDDITVNEDAGSAVLTVSLNHLVSTVVKVDFVTEDSTATDTDDYQATTGTLTFTPGELTQTISIPLINSDFPESIETFLVYLRNVQAGTANVTIADDQGIVSIHDNVYAISIALNSTSEYNTTTHVRVSLNQALNSDLTVNYFTSDLTASQSEDYVATSGTLLIPAGDTINWIPIPIIDSDLVEVDETFLISLSDLQATGYDLIYTLQELEVTIQDNDRAYFSIGDNQTVNEAAGTVDLTVTLDQAVDTSITVDYVTTSQNADATTDYVAQSGTLTFAAGELSKTITVPIVDSDQVEETETFLVDLSNIQAAGRDVFFSDYQAIVTITDDDQAKISIDDITVNEGAGTATLTVSLDKPVDTEISVDFATAASSAKESTDYQSTSGTINFSAGELSQTITIPLVDSDLVEGDEIFLVNLSNIQSNLDVIFSDDQGEVTIQDNDQATVSINDITVNENHEFAILTVSLDQIVDYSVRVYYTTADQSAIQSEDYSYASDDTFILAGTLTASITIPLSEYDTGFVEYDETFLVNLTGIESYGRDVNLADDQAEVIIIDNDQARISIDDVSKDEAAGTVTLTVSLDQPVDTTVTVDYTTADQSATSPDDYLSQSGSLMFNPGEQSKTITISIYDSLIIEGDETFLVNLSNIQSNGLDVVFADDQATVTIRDEKPKITITDKIVYELYHSVSLTVSLDQAVANIVTLDYTTVSQSAIEGADFQGKSGTLIFNPGELSKTFSVTVFNSDDPFESDETFLVNLSNIQSDGIDVIFEKSQAEVTIYDESLPLITIDDVEVIEGAYGKTTYAVFTVTRTGKSPGDLNHDVYIDYSTLDGSATVADSDYEATSGSLRFNPVLYGLSQTRTFQVEINGDRWTELDEFFQLQLSLKSGSAVLIDDIGFVNIINDDQTSLSIDNVTVDKTAGKALVTVSLSNPIGAGELITLDYSTSPGTAIPGVDYNQWTSGTITFGAHQWSQTIHITTYDNDLNQFEPDKTFYVDLSNIQTNGLNVGISSTRGTVTLENTDSTPYFEYKSKIFATDNPQSYAEFGGVLDVDNDTLISSSIKWDSAQVDQGAAFIYVRNQQGTPDDLTDDTWEYQAILFAPDGKSGDYFGSSVAIHGDTAVVGAKLAATGDQSSDTGAVYIYKRTGSVWTFQQKIVAADSIDGDEFGSLVAIEGDTIVVRAAEADSEKGAVYIFNLSDELWSESAKFIDQSLPQWSSWTDFGSSLDINNSTIVIGSRNDGESAIGAGAVFIVTRENGTWSVTQKLKPISTSLIRSFGSSVAIAGNTLVVGAPDSYKPAYYDLGAVLTFTLEDGIWMQSKVLYAADTTNYSSFGKTVAFQDDLLLVESNNLQDGTNNNSEIHVLQLQGQNWIELNQFHVPDKDKDIHFGASLRFSNGTIFIGSPYDEDSLRKGTIQIYGPVHLPEVTVDNASIAVKADGSRVLILEITRSEENPGDLSSPGYIEFGTFNIGDSSGNYQSITGAVSFEGDLNAISQTQMITLPIGSEIPLKLDETFALELLSISGDGYFPETVIPITVVDNPPLITIDDISVEENHGTATLTVSLSQPVATTVTVDYATANKYYASSSEDYLQSSGTLSFNPGDQTKTITIPLVDSDLVESNETFLVNLSHIQSGGTAVYLGDHQAQVTITDNDQATVSIDDVTVNENAGTVTLTVSLDGEIDTRITVEYATIDQSAQAPHDYLPQNGTIGFNPGEHTQTITVQLTDDNLLELTEMFEIELGQLNSNGRNVTIADSRGRVEILDDDEVQHSEFESKIFGPGTIHNYDHFGYSTDIDGDTLITSTPEWDGTTTDQGAAFIYVRNSQGTPYDLTDDTWDYQATLLPPDEISHVDFGSTVAISGDTAIVADYKDKYPDYNSGAVYVFTRTGTTWTFQQKLKSSDADGGQYFGGAIDIQNDTIVVGATYVNRPGDDGVGSLGASGAAYVFNRINGTWQETAKLLDDDPHSSKHFGSRVAIDNSTILIGAINDGYQDAQSPFNTGAVYVFSLSNGNWEQVQKLKASVSYPSGDFGNSIAIEGDTIAVGVRYHQTTSPDTHITYDTGAAYIFTRDADNHWNESQILLPSNISSENSFGSGVEISDGMIVVGSSGDPNTPALNNTLYLFTQQDLTWELLDKIYGQDLDDIDGFGWSFVVTENSILVSAMNDDEKMTDGGSIFVYSRTNIPEISIESVEFTEGDNGSQLATVQVTRRGRNFGDLTLPALVNFTTLDGTATVLGGDYTETSGTIAFSGNSGVLSQTEFFTIEILGDTQREADEEFRVVLSEVFGSASLAQSTSTITIINDDLFRVSIDDLTVNESTQTAELTVTLDQPLSTEVNLNFRTNSQSAKKPEDFLDTSGSLTFNPGELTKTITVPIIDSNQVELDEQFLVQLYNLQSDSEFVIFSDSQAIVTIIDDDQAQISIDDLSVDEQTGSASLTVSLDAPVDKIVTFDFSTADQTALSTKDYYATTGTVTINPGEQSATITIPLRNSTLAEPDKTFLVNLSNLQADGRDVTLADEQVEITIIDSDEVRFYVSVDPVDESAGTVTATVTLSQSIDTALHVDYTTADFQALTSIDFQPISGTLTFNPGETTQSITASIIDDDITEIDEIFLIKLTKPENTEGELDFSDNSFHISILDDDQTRISINDITVDEDTQAATLTVSLDHAAARVIIFDYATADSSATAGSDYQSTSGTVSFSIGSLTKTITIPLIDSDLVEVDETFFVNLLNLNSQGLDIAFADTQGVVTIIDNDQAQVSIDDISVDEVTGFATVTVSLDHPVDGTVTLDYATADQTALAGEDFQATSGTLTFNPGELSKTFAVNLINSDLIEVDKTFLVNLSNLQSAGLDVILPDSQAQVTIVDSDQPELTINNVTIDEYAGTATVTVSLNQPLTTILTVDFATADDSASSPSDYQALSGTLTFNPGETTQTINISIINSDLTEMDETFLINLINPQSSEYQITLTDSQSEVTIVDDDQTTISINDITINENEGTATLTVSLDHVVETAISIEYATTDGSASSSSDYQSTSGTLTFESGNASQTIVIPIVDSDLVEIDETFFVNLLNLQSNGANVILTETQGTVTIHDDDQASISVNDLSVDENAGTATLTVSLNHPVATTVTIDFEMRDGTALNDSDYTSAMGTLTFNPGETTQTINLIILDDDLVEPSESFSVNLTNLQANSFNVELGNNQAEITILDDNQAILSIDDIVVSEDVGTATLTVSLDHQLSTVVSVDYETIKGTAIDNSDFLSSTGTVTFSPGEVSQTITISIVNSNLVELTETLQVLLTNLQVADNLVIMADPQGEIEIRDDDQATISIDDVSVNEDAGFAEISVSLSQAVDTSITVDFYTSNQSAFAGTDFEYSAGTLTFNPEVLNQKITINLVDNDLVEIDETFRVFLNNLQTNNSDVIFVDIIGQVTIVDDDQATISIDDISVDENAGIAILTVSLPQIVSTPVSVDYSTFNGSAISGSDYLTTSGTLTFNFREHTKTITVSLIDIDRVEADETFLVNLSNIQSSTADVVFTDDQGEVTIVDDDQATISINDVTVNEAAGTATISVSLSQVVDTDISLDYATTDETAVDSVDYLSRSGTLTLYSGAMSRNITVDLVDNQFIELDETFFIDLSNLNSNGFNVIVADAHAEVTIQDNDLVDYEFKSKLHAVNPQASNDLFGYDIAVDGDTMISSALYWDADQANQGGAFIYVRNDQGTPNHPEDDTWAYQATLLAPNPAVGDSDRFGWKVAISGDTAVVGAPYQDGSGVNSGSLYVFSRTGTTWSFQQELSVPETIDNDYFGNVIAIEGDTIVVGVPSTDNFTGAVNVFNRVNGVWSKSTTLVAEDADENDFFGNAVDIENATIVIGARHDSETIPQSGAVYVFSLENGLWSQTQKLKDSTPGYRREFGVSISLEGNDLLIGSSSNHDLSYSSGKADLYTFDPENNLWNHSQTLTASDAAHNSQFGIDVLIKEDLILIGAVYDPASNNFDPYSSHTYSAVYVFEKENLNWVEQQKLDPAQSVKGDSFGREFDLSNGSIFVSSNLDDDGFENSGSVYVFGPKIIPDVSIGDLIVTEGDNGLQTVSVAVTRTGTKPGDLILPASVNFQSIDGTATVSAGDYEAISGTINFGSEATSLTQTETITFQIFGDTRVELDENFGIELLNLTGYAQLTQSMSTITIQNDDQASISINNLTVDEDAGTATLTVSLSQMVDTAVSVDFATANQTALDQDDYQAKSGTLTFNPGEQTKSITVSIVDSDLLERPETFLVNLFNLQASSPNVTLADDQAEVTIIDDGSATAEINMRVVNSPTHTQPNGEAATLPENQNWVSEWAVYWVEIWVNASSPAEQGVFSAALDFHYITEFTSAAAIEFGAAFTQNQTGIINDLAGTIEGLYAETNVSGLGSDNQLLFARIKFEPLAEDQVSLDLSGKSIGPYELGFSVSSQQVSLVGDVPALTHLGSFNGTSIWANPMDFNDDDEINFRDLVIFASLYNSTPSQSRSDYAWFADFDQNNRVNFRDLVLLVSNYGKNKLSRKTVSYPANYPDVWNQPLRVDTQTILQSTPPQSLTQSAAATVLESVVEQASPSLAPSESKTLENINIQVVDLDGDTLGRAVAGTIYIDVNAAGYGWFIDTTPADHSEFAWSSELTLIALPESEAAGQIDLWTVILHELGHILGYEHENEGVMQESLAPGVRNLPTWDEDVDSFFSTFPDDAETLFF